MLTNESETVIIHESLRECWNGRQARLRCVWFRRVGSSPISRTKISAAPCGVADIFMLRWDMKGGEENSSVECFLTVKESLKIPDPSDAVADGFLLVSIAFHV